jgi:hypothetical protein
MDPSRIVRRTHMYLALLLSPWMLMYALSTTAMNHRETLERLEEDGPSGWVLESRSTYTGVVAPDATRRAIAAQILRDLELEGDFDVSRNRRNGRLTIRRQAALTPRRVVFDPASGELSVERQERRLLALMQRLHHRRGFGAGTTLDNLWATAVDLVILSMLVWAASGLWMWWQMRIVRRWGAVSLAAGVVLFGFFLLAI